MTYSLAHYYSKRSEWQIADDLAESRLYFDPGVKKLKEQIKQHKEAIAELERKLAERHTKLSATLLSEAIEKREEAQKIIELHKQLEIEFEKKLKNEA